MKSGHIRALIAISALLLGAALVARGSSSPTVFGRYSFSYFLLLVAYGPLLLSAVLFGIVARDIGQGVRTVSRSGAFWLVLVLILVPAALVGVRWLRTGESLDVVRVAGLLSLAGSYTLAALALAGREGSHAFRVLQSSFLLVVPGVYLATFLITPVFGDMIERRMGLPAETTFRLTQPDDYDRSLMHEPGSRFTYTGPPGQVREFAVPVVNNSWGFHDRERSFENPDGRPRIVVLGSYVQALEVPRDSGFSALLEDRLSHELAGAEVIRLARRTGGQAEQLELLQEYGRKLEPRLVILVLGTNDLLRNDPDLASLSVQLPDAVLFPGLLIDRLATQWLQKRAYLLGERYQLGVLRPDYWAYLEPTPTPVTEAMAETEALLDQLVEESRTMGAELLLVIKRPTNTLRWLRRFPSLRAYRINTDAHADWLGSYAASRGVHFLDLGPPLQAHYDRYPTGHEQQYSWPHAGFLREPGHRLTAELLYDTLVRSNLLRVEE